MAVTFISLCRSAAALLRSPVRVVLSLLVALTCVAGAQAATRTVTASTADATRAELTARLDSLQRESARGGTPAQRRTRDTEIGAIRTRLAQGDFQPGDRFLIDFAADRKGDTVVVHEGEMISLVNWPSTSLHGVLRSELEGAVQRYIATFIREPRVRVYPLTRLAIVGAVGRPGYYAVDPQRPLSDAIMVAGGPAAAAQYDKISVYRGGERLMREKDVTRVLREGRTIDDLGLRAGDQVRVSERRTRNWGPIVQATVIGLTALTAVLAIIRSAYSD